MLVVPKTAFASASRSGCQTSSTFSTASITPSGSRSATLLLPGVKFLGKLLGDVERDRHGPEHAAGQAHVVADALVVGAIHEAAQGRESAAQQQFQIA